MGFLQMLQRDQDVSGLILCGTSPRGAGGAPTTAMYPAIAVFSRACGRGRDAVRPATNLFTRRARRKGSFDSIAACFSSSTSLRDNGLTYRAAMARRVQ